MASRTSQLGRLMNDLDPSRSADAAAACAALCMVLNQRSLQVPPGLATRLLELIQHDDAALQRNAIAALSAAVESDDGAAAEALQGSAAAALSRLLAAATAGGPPGESTAANVGLLVNATTALGALAESGPDGLRSVVDAGAFGPALALCSPEQPATVQEAAVDCVCKCMAGGVAGKNSANDAGAVPALAALLGQGAGGEVKVRALLGLGMLIGGRPERQLQLVAAPGAVAALLALLRQGDDGDCQQIAAGIFKELGGSGDAGVKSAVAAAVKAAQERVEAEARYVG